MLIPEQRELAAYRSLFAAGQGLFGPDAFEILDFRPASALRCRLMPEVPQFNRVLGLGGTRPITAAVLDEVGAWYASLHAPVVLELPPAARDAGTKPLLRAHGIRAAAQTVMLQSSSTPSLATPAVPQVCQAGQELQPLLGSLCARVFGLPSEAAQVLGRLCTTPGWTGWLAWIDGEPAAAALMYTEGSTAWLGWDATDPRFRGRGAQAALIAARLRHARGLGCVSMSSETAPATPTQPSASLKNYLRHGFEPVYVRTSFIRPCRPC